MKSNDEIKALVETLNREETSQVLGWLDSHADANRFWRWVGVLNLLLAISGLWTEWTWTLPVVLTIWLTIIGRSLYVVFIDTPERYIKRLKNGHE